MSRIDSRFIQKLEDRLAEYQATAMQKLGVAQADQSDPINFRTLAALEEYAEAKGRAEGLAIAIGYAKDWDE